MTRYSPSLVADVLSVSKTTLASWEKSGKLKPLYDETTDEKYFCLNDLLQFKKFQDMQNSAWDSEIQIKPKRPFKCIELFAGAGGLALGLEKAGFHSVLLNDIDSHACKTLKNNRPSWNVIEGDISKISFTHLKGTVDLVSGGFPCQAFSYAGKKLGFDDTRGTLFFEYGRAISETQPKIMLAENVKGLLSHEEGRTLDTIKNAIDNLGYELIAPRVLQAIFYQVPQKRERLILIAIRKDIAHLIKDKFQWPSPYKRIMVLKDALEKGILYDCDVPLSEGQKYPKRKAEILNYVPQGGYWRDLSDDLQREYMQASYFMGGGKTGMARRLSMNEPSLTLTCSPAQKQTERCHPLETRPLTVREYARIQTFPDDWIFSGSIHQQYKQIGNAVPVNLGYAVARSLVRLLNLIEEQKSCDLNIANGLYLECA
jgi:DNA (cytosine-5)-methyltransferase 1